MTLCRLLVQSSSLLRHASSSSSNRPQGKVIVAKATPKPLYGLYLVWPGFLKSRVSGGHWWNAEPTNLSRCTGNSRQSIAVARGHRKVSPYLPMHIWHTQVYFLLHVVFPLVHVYWLFIAFFDCLHASLLNPKVLWLLLFLLRKYSSAGGEDHCMGNRKSPKICTLPETCTWVHAWPQPKQSRIRS